MAVTLNFSLKCELDIFAYLIMLIYMQLFYNTRETYHIELMIINLLLLYIDIFYSLKLKAEAHYDAVSIMATSCRQQLFTDPNEVILTLTMPNPY